MRYFLVLAFFFLVPLIAQEFYVDPETGKPKLILDDPEQPVEEILSSSAYAVGSKTYSIPFDLKIKGWTLPPLTKAQYLRFNRAATAVGKGQKKQLSAFPKKTVKKKTLYDVKATPYFWNLLEDNLDKQKRIAKAASQVAEEHGEALIFKLLLSSSKEVRAPAWNEVNRLTRDALIGVWVHSENKDVHKTIAEKIIGKKEKNTYQKLRDKISNAKNKDGWKVAFGKKTPQILAQLFIDHLLTRDDLPWDDKQKKSVGKLLKSSKANKTWKTLANVRLGNKVSVSAIQKISRDKDWYIRSRACRAVSYRNDLAWDVVPFLLERQRDVNLFVRHAANEALLKLHTLPYELKSKHIVKFDTEVIIGWETWWDKQNSMGKDIKSVSKEKKFAKFRLVKNQKVFYGASTQNFNVLVGKHKKIKKSIYLVDVNKDGDFEDFGVDRITIGSIETKPSVLLSRVISDGKKLYLIDINSKKRELRLKPYKGKKTTIDFNSSFAASHKPKGIVVSSAPDMNFLIDSNGPTTLPLADYKFSAGWVLKKGSEAARIAETLDSPIFSVSKDTTTPVSFGANLKLELDFEFDKSRKTITLKPADVIGQGGEFYKKIKPELDKIEVFIEVNGKKDPKRRDWISDRLDVSTNMLGGLVPPFKPEQIPAYRQNYEDYNLLKLTDIPTLGGDIFKLKFDLSQLKAQLSTEQAKPTEEQNQELINTLTSQVSDIETNQIPTKEQELLTKESERDRLRTYLDGGAGLAGRSFIRFIDSLYKEEGLKLLARAMSDIVWKNYTIDLKKVKGAKNAEEVTVILKSQVSFGKIEEKRLTISLK